MQHGNKHDDKTTVFQFALIEVSISPKKTENSWKKITKKKKEIIKCEKQ